MFLCRPTRRSAMGPSNRAPRRCRSIYAKPTVVASEDKEDRFPANRNHYRNKRKDYALQHISDDSCLLHNHYLLGKKRKQDSSHVWIPFSQKYRRLNLERAKAAGILPVLDRVDTNENVPMDTSETNENAPVLYMADTDKNAPDDCTGVDEETMSEETVDQVPHRHTGEDSLPLRVDLDSVSAQDRETLKSDQEQEQSTEESGVCNTCSESEVSEASSERSSLNDSGILSPAMPPPPATPPVLGSEEEEADFAIDIFRSRVLELRKVKCELERTKKELEEVKEQAKRDRLELERQLRTESAAKLELEREEMNKTLDEANSKASDAETRMKAMAKEKVDDVKKVKKMANDQILATQRRCQEHLEKDRNKAKQKMEDALRLAEDRTAKKVETVQRQMQGKVDAAERECRREVDEVHRATRKEVEMNQRKAEQAAIKYNKLIAEHVVLQSKISDAARLLNMDQNRGNMNMNTNMNTSAKY